ncbi:MAG: MgtC/SapB family protein [Acidobacteriota bacterium]
MEEIKAFAEALLIGLLIGSERYKGRREGEFQTAGVRTFPIISLLGAACSLVHEPLLTTAVFASLVVFLALGYSRDPSESYGLTTEMAALLTFWLGYLVADHEVLIISTSIVVVILLASKKPLHEFVRRQVSEQEFFDTLKFLAVVFVVFPLLPDRYLGPFGFFNPRRIWFFVVLVSSISYLGYILMRLLGGRRGLFASAVLGGLVSTTAVTLSLAQRSREDERAAPLCGVVAVLANSVQFGRLLVLLLVVHQGFGVAALPLLGAMGAVGVAGAWLLGRFLSIRGREDAVTPMLRNPFSLVPVLKFGVFFMLVMLVNKLAADYLGGEGVTVAAALSGFGGVSAVALTLAELVKTGALEVRGALEALLAAVAVNVLTKWGLAWAQGERRFVLWLGGGLASMVIVGGIILLAGVV